MAEVRYLYRIKPKAFARKTQITRLYEEGFSGLDAFREDAEEIIDQVNADPDFDNGRLVGDAFWAWLHLSKGNRATVKKFEEFGSEEEARIRGFSPVTMVKVYRNRSFSAAESN